VLGKAARLGPTPYGGNQASLARRGSEGAAPGRRRPQPLAIPADQSLSVRIVERHSANHSGTLEARHRAEAVACAPRRGPAAPAPGDGADASPPIRAIAVRSR
jgi:hypothetical protein